MNPASICGLCAEASSSGRFNPGDGHARAHTVQNPAGVSRQASVWQRNAGRRYSAVMEGKISPPTCSREQRRGCLEPSGQPLSAESADTEHAFSFNSPHRIRLPRRGLAGIQRNRARRQACLQFFLFTPAHPMIFRRSRRNSCHTRLSGETHLPALRQIPDTPGFMLINNRMYCSLARNGMI